MVYLITMMSIIVICATSKLARKAKRSMVSGRKCSQPSCSTIPANAFELAPLPGLSAVLICTVIYAVSTSAQGCQHGYMRHNTHLVCNGKIGAVTNTTELYFNRLQSELCIEIFTEIGQWAQPNLSKKWNSNVLKSLHKNDKKMPTIPGSSLQNSTGDKAKPVRPLPENGT
ncbi:hypothetical protein RB195_010161 [Necator americanus]|uniref:Uncharacterized protein n=1 Tax=Necator americanus TaxID=51031 RepID=A0ABR1CXX9_NECAM